MQGLRKNRFKNFFLFMKKDYAFIIIEWIIWKLIRYTW